MYYAYLCNGTDNNIINIDIPLDRFTFITSSKGFFKEYWYYKTQITIDEKRNIQKYDYTYNKYEYNDKWIIIDAEVIKTIETSPPFETTTEYVYELYEIVSNYKDTTIYVKKFKDYCNIIVKSNTKKHVEDSIIRLNEYEEYKI